jgi:hypothetical protein
MSLIFQNGSRTQSFGPGEKMPALPQQPKASQPSFGKPPGSSQDYYLTKQPAGQAQSTPTPSQGTPYAAYAPNSSSSYAANTDGVNRTYNTNNYNNADAGNFANNPASRPAPFTQGATGLGGQQFSDPSQAFAQRDAMIDRLNNSKSKYTANAGVYQGDGPPPASFGQRPQYDFNSLMGQANDIVQQGWTNPFSQPAGGQPQPASPGGFPNPPPSYGQQVMTGQRGAAYYPGGPGGFPTPPPSPRPQLGAEAGYPGFDPRTQAPSGQPLRPENAQPIAPQQPGSYYPGFDPRTQDPYGQPRHSRKNPDVPAVPLPPDHPLRRPGSFRPMPRGFEQVERPPVYMGGQRLTSDPTNGLRQPRERASYGISRRR